MPGRFTNIQTLQLFTTPAPGDPLSDSDHFIAELGHLTGIANVDDWLEPANRAELQRLAIVLLRRVCDLEAAGIVHLQPVDATVFVEHLANKMKALRGALSETMKAEMGRSASLRRRLEASARRRG
jgi:hypothetical protein